MSRSDKTELIRRTLKFICDLQSAIYIKSVWCGHPRVHTLYIFDTFPTYIKIRWLTCILWYCISTTPPSKFVSTIRSLYHSHGRTTYKMKMSFSTLWRSYDKENNKNFSMDKIKTEFLVCYRCIVFKCTRFLN